MKFEFNWPSGFCENCLNILMGLQYEQHWLNGQRSTLTFGTYLIRFNISSKYVDFGFNSVQKINFSKKIHLNALGSQFHLVIKYFKINLGSSFEQTWLALHPQCYIPRPKDIGLLALEKIFKGFLPYMGVVAILVM